MKYRFRMLYDFLISNCAELTNRCREMVAKRSPRVPAADTHGVSLFLWQIIDTLSREKLTSMRSAPEPEPIPSSTEIGRAAALHGAELFRSGYVVGQVVYEYGDVLQAVTQLAAEQKALFTVDEFRTLHRCIDNATAEAVTAFASGHNRAISRPQERRQTRVASTNERRQMVNAAIQSFSAINPDSTELTGATDAVIEVRDLVGQSARERRRVPRAGTRPHQ
jgi:hypothetical protein